MGQTTARYAKAVTNARSLVAVTADACNGTKAATLTRTGIVPTARILTVSLPTTQTSLPIACDQRAARRSA